VAVRYFLHATKPWANPRARYVQMDFEAQVAVLVMDDDSLDDNAFWWGNAVQWTKDGTWVEIFEKDFMPR